MFISNSLEYHIVFTKSLRESLKVLGLLLGCIRAINNKKLKS